MSETNHMSLTTIGAELHADSDFGLTCIVTIPGQAAVETTVRATGSQVVESQQRSKKRSRLSCFLCLLAGAVARPPKETVIVITGATQYAGTWRTEEAGEPTGHGEWRCPAVLDTTTHVIAPSAGSPKRAT